LSSLKLKGTLLKATLDERFRNIISTYNLGDNYADEVMYIITIVKEEMGIF